MPRKQKPPNVIVKRIKETKNKLNDDSCLSNVISGKKKSRNTNRNFVCHVSCFFCCLFELTLRPTLYVHRRHQGPFPEMRAILLVHPLHLQCFVAPLRPAESVVYTCFRTTAGQRRHRNSSAILNSGTPTTSDRWLVLSPRSLWPIEA